MKRRLPSGWRFGFVLQLHDRVVVMNRFPDANPHVDDAQPANRAADKILCKEVADRGMSQHEEILIPHRNPRQDRDEDSEFNAEHHEHDHRDAVYPDDVPGYTFGRTRSLRWRLSQNWRAGVQSAFILPWGFGFVLLARRIHLLILRDSTLSGL